MGLSSSSREPDLWSAAAQKALTLLGDCDADQVRKVFEAATDPSRPPVTASQVTAFVEALGAER